MGDVSLWGVRVGRLSVGAAGDDWMGPGAGGARNQCCRDQQASDEFHRALPFSFTRYDAAVFAVDSNSACRRVDIRADWCAVPGSKKAGGASVCFATGWK